MADKIIGVFDTEQEATRAIESLQAQGIKSDEISVITRDRDEQKSISEDTGTMAPEGVATGAATGGVVGGVAGLLAGIGALAIPGIGPILAAGPIAATLTGAAVGVGAGGLVGGLIGLGIPEDEAREYEGYIDSGKILVLVDDNGRGRDIHTIFSGNRSLNAGRYNSLYPLGETLTPGGTVQDNRNRTSNNTDADLYNPR
ncbi:general stress protein [Paenibacillus sp. FSL K6-1096]|uniref:general stress protein n=1 Tax=Paenibacillus sp. FSL K6-1096 TaxID=2921460 RepID=UPI0030EC05F2